MKGGWQQTRKKETHIFGQENDRKGTQKSGDRDRPHQSPDGSPSGPFAVKAADSTDYRLLPPDETPLLAGIVENGHDPTESESAAPLNHPHPSLRNLLAASAPVDIASEFQNMAAIGGAVGALVLGSWSIISAMITPWASINAIIAIVLGFYGLKSKRKRMASLGIALGLAGLVLSLFDLNEFLTIWFSSETFA